MITFFRTRECSGCAAIQELLGDLSIAHKVVVLDKSQDLPAEYAASGPPPLLVDGGEVIRGGKSILSHLEKLEEFSKLWYKFQSDACYCDKKGNIE